MSLFEKLDKFELKNNHVGVIRRMTKQQIVLIENKDLLFEMKKRKYTYQNMIDFLEKEMDVEKELIKDSSLKTFFKNQKEDPVDNLLVEDIVQKDIDVKEESSIGKGFGQMDIEDLIVDITETLNNQLQHSPEYEETFICSILNNDFLKNNIKIHLESREYRWDEGLVLFEGCFNKLEETKKKELINCNTEAYVHKIELIGNTNASFYLTLYFLSRIEEFFDWYEGSFRKDIDELQSMN